MKLKKLKVVRLLDAKGFTLLSVLLLLIIVTVLGVSILTMTGNSLKLSTNERTDQSTFYIAEAGIVETRKAMDLTVQKAYKDAYEETKNEYNRLPIKEQETFDFATKLEGSYLNKVTTELSRLSPRQLSSFEPTYSENNTLTKPSAIVNVNIDKISGEELQYKITSVGTIGNKERSVSQKLTVNLNVGNLGAPGIPGIPESPGIPGHGAGGSLPGDMAIIVRNKIKILSPLVTGNVATLSSGVESIEIGWNSTDNLSFFVPSGSESTALKKPQHLGSIPRISGISFGEIPKLPIFPIPPTYHIRESILEKGSGSAPPLVLRENSHIKKLEISGSRTLEIDVGDTDKELVLDEFSILGDAQVILKGTGKLTLYVKNKFRVMTSRFGSPNNNIEIFYSGNDALNSSAMDKKTQNIGGHTKIYASIYAEKADVEIAGSTEIHGNILSGGTSFKVTGHGDVLPSLYFAPNAHFEVGGSGKVEGTIIGNSISVTGSGEVHFGKPQFNTWVPGIPSTPGTPGTPPTKSENPELTKTGPLIEI